MLSLFAAYLISSIHGGLSTILAPPLLSHSSGTKKTPENPPEMLLLSLPLKKLPRESVMAANQFAALLVSPVIRFVKVVI